MARAPRCSQISFTLLVPEAQTRKLVNKPLALLERGVGDLDAQWPARNLVKRQALVGSFRSLRDRGVPWVRDLRRRRAVRQIALHAIRNLRRAYKPVGACTGGAAPWRGAPFAGASRTQRDPRGVLAGR